jgi:hypothetical protein
MTSSIDGAELGYLELIASMASVWSKFANDLDSYLNIICSQSVKISSKVGIPMIKRIPRKFHFEVGSVRWETNLGSRP